MNSERGEIQLDDACDRDRCDVPKISDILMHSLSFSRSLLLFLLLMITAWLAFMSRDWEWSTATDRSEIDAAMESSPVHSMVVGVLTYNKNQASRIRAARLSWLSFVPNVNAVHFNFNLS